VKAEKALISPGPTNQGCGVGVASSQGFMGGFGFLILLKVGVRLM